MTPPSLAHLPLPLFAAPMGLGGLGLMWREAAATLGAPAWLGEALLAAASLLWLGLVALQAERLRRHPAALRAELAHPLRAPFAGAASIGMMIVAGFLIPYSPGVAAILWICAVAAHLCIAVVLLRRLLLGRWDATALAPPMLIPLVGNIIAPLFGVALGAVVLSWLLFGIGAMLWLVVQPLLLHRLLAGPPLPERLRPALAIFLAPPAVASLAAAGLLGGMLHPLPLAMFGAALLVAAALLSIAPDIARAPPSAAAWGLTFPAAAFGTAAIRLLDAAPSAAGLWLAALLLGGVSAIVLGVAWRTTLAARAGAFLHPEA